MAETSQRLRLMLKTRFQVAVAGEMIWQNLYGNETVEPAVARFEDLAETTSPDGLYYFIRTESCPCCEGHCFDLDRIKYH